MKKKTVDRILTGSRSSKKKTTRTSDPVQEKQSPLAQQLYFLSVLLVQPHFNKTQDMDASFVCCSFQVFGLCLFLLLCVPAGLDVHYVHSGTLIGTHEPSRAGAGNRTQALSKSSTCTQPLTVSPSLLFTLFETGSHLSPRLTSDLQQFSCLSLSSDKIKGNGHHTIILALYFLA